MKETFIDKAFRRDTLAMIEQANEIIDEMQADGYTLTVRQLYYQFVSRALLANKQTNYQRLASIIDDGRKAGLIDWGAIEDRTRYLRHIPHYSSPGKFINEVVDQYAENLWGTQSAYLEVWIEKDALLGVIERTCNQYRVPYFACRGYASSSELYEAGKRMERMSALGKQCFIFHFGDHDPSGLDMTRANDEALRMFSGLDNVHVLRLALNRDQINTHRPPPNPAKDTDSRFNDYAQKHGVESWELDALPPQVINNILRTNIEKVLNMPAFNKALVNENRNSGLLRRTADNWDAVADFVNTLED